DLARFDAPGADPTRAFTHRAIVEGDASRVEAAYVDALPPDERAEYLGRSREEYEEFVDETAEVPGALLAFQGAPYALGRSFLDVVTAVEGDDAVDALLDDPPASEEQLFDPFRYLDGDAPVKFTAPDVPRDAEVIEEGV